MTVPVLVPYNIVNVILVVCPQAKSAELPLTLVLNSSFFGCTALLLSALTVWVALALHTSLVGLVRVKTWVQVWKQHFRVSSQLVLAVRI